MIKKEDYLDEKKRTQRKKERERRDKNTMEKSKLACLL